MKKSLLIIMLLSFIPSAALGDIPTPIAEADEASLQLNNIDGASLYRENCAHCHGALEETHIPDRRPGRITSAIRHVGSMGKMKHLSALQIIGISRALKSEPDTLTNP